ncbi:hypothetical protein B0T24DRAFT_592665 [Lasiosphaeria ovina]|uniref:Uncharacterized protein n=1 Tax=Lasiosphaeria ovina TaxID=92902 RepID=A0AAE0KHV9_9PEZI|nr:hypothetical protein B0T24DRAFT_592665 [Lasiosphaeria ovina]
MTNITNVSAQQTQQVVYDVTKQDSISLTDISRTRSIAGVDAWDIANAVLKLFQEGDSLGTLFGNVLGTVGYIELENSAEDWDRASVAMLGLGRPNYTDENSLFNSTALALSMQSYYHIHTAFLVQSVLMEPISEVATAGYAQVLQNRLVVQPLASQVFAA